VKAVSRPSARIRPWRFAALSRAPVTIEFNDRIVA
jgi:hypothetical protein